MGAARRECDEEQDDRENYQWPGGKRSSTSQPLVMDDVRWNNPSEHDIGPIFKEKATRCMTIEDY